MCCHNCPYSQRYMYAMNPHVMGRYMFQQPYYYQPYNMNAPFIEEQQIPVEQVNTPIGGNNPVNLEEENNPGAFTHQFLNENGQIDVNKMLTTVGQLAQTVQQVSPVIKQVNDIIQSFRA